MCDNQGEREGGVQQWLSPSGEVENLVVVQSTRPHVSAVPVWYCRPGGLRRAASHQSTLESRRSSDMSEGRPYVHGRYTYQ